MSDALLTLYRHKTWATLRLIEYCQGIDAEHLDATIPGTYGTIRETLRHLVEAEEGYFFRVTGERLLERMPEGPVALDELADRIRRLGPRWPVTASCSRASWSPATVGTCPRRYPWPRRSITPTTIAAT